MATPEKNDSISDVNNSKLCNVYSKANKKAADILNDSSHHSNNTTLKIHTTKNADHTYFGGSKDTSDNDIEEQEEADRNQSRQTRLASQRPSIRASMANVLGARGSLQRDGSVKDVQKRRSTHATASMSVQAAAARRLRRRGQCSYWLAPPPGREFPWIRCKDVVEGTISNFFSEVRYTHSLVSDVKLFCNSVINQLCRHPAMDVTRLLCHVTLVQLRRQGIVVADRASGHKGIDNRYSTVRKFKTYAVVVSVFGVYKE